MPAFLLFYQYSTKKIIIFVAFFFEFEPRTRQSCWLALYKRNRKEKEKKKEKRKGGGGGGGEEKEKRKNSGLVTCLTLLPHFPALSVMSLATK